MLQQLHRHHKPSEHLKNKIHNVHLSKIGAANPHKPSQKTIDIVCSSCSNPSIWVLGTSQILWFRPCFQWFPMWFLLTRSKKNISNILIPSEKKLFPGRTWITWKYKTHIVLLFLVWGLCLMCSMLFHWFSTLHSCDIATPDLRVTEKTLHVQVIIDLQGGGFCGIATSWCTLLSSLWQLWSPYDSYMVHGRYN
jgi:hypothetical protein